MHRHRRPGRVWTMQSSKEGAPMPNQYTGPGPKVIPAGHWLIEHGPIQERFWKKVIQKDKCWLWTASLDRDGYARIAIGGKVRFAHRISYESYKGPIPQGMSIDHLCRTRNCVNPNHLEAVTHKENVNRGALKFRSLSPSCPRYARKKKMTCSFQQLTTENGRQ